MGFRRPHLVQLLAYISNISVELLCLVLTQRLCYNAAQVSTCTNAGLMMHGI